MGAPEPEKPLLSKGAGWVLFVSTVVPTLFLVGTILLVEATAIERVVGVLFLALGALALVGATVAVVRRAPRK